MVLELTDSLCRYPSEKEGDVLSCITNILIGYYEGNFLLMATEEICDFFAGKVSELRAIQALAYLKNNCSFSYNVQYFFKVVMNDNVSDKYELPLSFFKRTSSIQPISILGENSSDINFFTRMAKELFPYANLKYNIVNGGGADTGNTLNNLQKKHIFILVIIDSDKKYINAEYGATYKSVKNAYNARLKHVKFFPLEVHEVENLLPLSFLLTTTNNEGKNFLARLKKIGNAKEILRYYDIKNGIKFKDVKGNMLYYQFAKLIYEKIYGNKKNNFELFISNIRNDNKQIFPGIRKNAMQKFLEEKEPKMDISLFKDELETIAKLIVTLACGRNGDPINL